MCLCRRIRTLSRFTSRRVLVLRRRFDVVYVRSRLSDAERQRGLHDLQVGELIVSRGALELKEDLLAAAGRRCALAPLARPHKRLAACRWRGSEWLIGTGGPMIGSLIRWSVSNPLIVVLLTMALAVAGAYAFSQVNVEAYPDPAPAIVEVIAQYPGRSAEEMERQVTIPLEVSALGHAGPEVHPQQVAVRLSYVNTQFEYGFNYLAARQEVINRMQMADLPHERHAADLAPLADRRDPAIRRHQSQGRARQQHLFAQRSASAGDLDAGTRVSPHSRASPTWSASAARSSATRFSPTPTA